MEQRGYYRYPSPRGVTERGGPPTVSGNFFSRPRCKTNGGEGKRAASARVVRERSGPHLRYLTSRRCRWCISCSARCVVRPPRVYGGAKVPSVAATLRATRKSVESTSVGSDLTSALSRSPSPSRALLVYLTPRSTSCVPCGDDGPRATAHAPLVPHRCPSATRKPYRETGVS